MTKSKPKPQFIDFKPMDICKIKIIPSISTEQTFINNIRKKREIIDAIYCPQCENEKIESRFEILDL